jgi:phospholipid/cholesterol/gamma-HCH transport system permease protein
VASLMVLTIIGDVLALVSASLVGQVLLDVDQHTYWLSLTTMLVPFDVIASVLKAAFFGAIIAATSCYFGLSTTGGAPGVGRTVNASVVTSAIAVFVVDYFSTFVMG